MLLNRNTKQPFPLSLSQALQRWQKYNLQAYFEQDLLLRVQDEAILEKLMKSRANRYIIECLNPRTAIIKKGCAEIIQAALTELGYLSNIKL